MPKSLILSDLSGKLRTIAELWGPFIANVTILGQIRAFLEQIARFRMPRSNLSLWRHPLLSDLYTPICLKSGALQPPLVKATRGIK
jgi:hypothetical protein